MLIYLDLYTEISGQNGKKLLAVVKPNPGESILFAHTSQIGNYCGQNTSSRIRGGANVFP
jgi:hypothetical protein